MKRPIDILFVASFRAPFIQDDLETLTKRFCVRTLIGHGIGQVFKIILGVVRSDVVFCWFASVYTSIVVMIATMFGIKTVIVAGGVDLAKNASLGYGIWLSRCRANLVRYALRHADRVLVGDVTMKKDAMRLAEYSGENIFYVPPAFDTEFWKPLGGKQLHVLTVAVVRDHRTLRRKGIDVLIEAARSLPQFMFIVVGVDAQCVFDLRPPENMTFHPPIPREALLSFYRQAKIYCQPSVHEAVCYTLREAMLCECVPVASDIGGMTTAVSGIGLLIPAGNKEALIAALLKAVNMSDEVGAKARARIVALYAREKRETELVRIVDNLI